MICTIKLSAKLHPSKCKFLYVILLRNFNIIINVVPISHYTFSMYRFGKRVSRAFSFNKTPRKLKRAMSSMTQMMSPFNRRESLSLTNVNTPGRGNLTAMRLASTNDLSVSTTMFFLSCWSGLLSSKFFYTIKIKSMTNFS